MSDIQVDWQSSDFLLEQSGNSRDLLLKQAEILIQKKEYDQAWTRLNREVRIFRLTTATLSLRRKPFPGSPILKPDRHVTATAQSLVVIRPIGHRVFRLGKFIAPTSVEFMRHRTLT